MEILAKNRNFRQKYKYASKKEILAKNINFAQQQKY